MLFSGIGSAAWAPAAAARARVDQAQAASEQVIAHIRGGDVSVDGQMLQPASTLVSVVNGNVVTVHSGEASMQLVDGGEISICGPAKVTVLAANGQITLALEFGSVHADLPKTASLRVLTPSIVATPIDIDGRKREVTFGLDQSGSLCVVASTGAVQLEQQFTGERLIVPEAADFELHNGQLVPSTDDGLSCKCAAVPQILPGEPSGQHYPAPETADQIPPPAEVALLSRTNGEHPIASADAQPTSVTAPDAPPVNAIVLPPMVFSAASSSSADIPTEETAMLIREVHAEPEWVYSGEVQAPAFAREMSKALGESGSSGNRPHAEATSQNGAQKTSKGFWASLKRFFAR